MSTKIEFHVLQSFPPANLNRDDTNTPKDCEFGGVRRARISSQCIKRAMRLHPSFAAATGVPPAERTRLLARDLKKCLLEIGHSDEESEQVANAFVSALLRGIDSKDPYRSKVLFYVSAEEKKSIAAELDAQWQKSLEGDFKDLIRAYRKEYRDRTSAPDIALFGRMLADEPALNLEASCQVAHAISTHKVSMEMDFFTAVDDLMQEGELGAGMMGVTGFNSATFYRYAAIDWAQLLQNLGGEVDLALHTVQGFLRALARAIPTGKQNAFAAQTPPTFILCVVRHDGQAWSLANAFEEPVQPQARLGGYMPGSLKALEKQWGRLNKVYGDEDSVHTFALLVDDELSLEVLNKGEVETLAALEEKLLSVLPPAVPQEA